MFNRTIKGITLITLGVRDIVKSRDFYKGLGFEIKSDDYGHYWEIAY
jgi:catechol 2,3-dioxygenase-like lactoylglutathione lyase family enzyme